MTKPVAIVTGAGRGIGRATAIALASRGYDLVLVARTQDDLVETQTLAGGGEIIAHDVSKSEEVAAVVARAVQVYGRVDACVHAAGVAPRLDIEQVTDEIWHETININLSAAFYLCRALWPIWKGQKSGVAVLISSQAARDPLSGFSAYAAAKVGLNLLGLTLAREGAPFGVRVHVVAPGATETAMLRKIATEQQVPSSVTMTPTDVADVVAMCVNGQMRCASGETIYLKKS